MAAKTTTFTFMRTFKQTREEMRAQDAETDEEISRFLFNNNLSRDQVTIKQSQSSSGIGGTYALTITLLYD